MVLYTFCHSDKNYHFYAYGGYLKNNYYLAFLALFIIFSCNTSFVTTSELKQARRKKIIAFTSKGGAGHLSTCKRLQEIFNNEYDVKVINPLETTLESIDTIKWVTRKRVDGEGLYNGMMQKGWNRSINFFCRHFAPKLFKQRRRAIERKLHDMLLEEKPDLLISTIPLINYPASQAAKKYGIPFALITLDLDLETWLLDVKKAGPDYFPITIPFETNLVYRQLLQQRIPLNKIHVVGPCLRQSFLEEKNVPTIKKEWNIPLEKKVVMVMMGGAGSRQIQKICKRLFKMNKHIHVLACIGRDAKMAQKIAVLKRHPAVSYTTIPFTQKIADLIAASDVLITKPGGQITSESIALKIPVIIDNTQPILFWEKQAAYYICDNGYGCIMKQFNQLDGLLDNWINKRKEIELNQTPLKQFDIEITKIIKNLLGDDLSTIVKTSNNNVIQPTKTC